MKKAIILLIGILSCSIIFAQKMNVHTGSGVSEYNLEDIDSITFNIGNTVFSDGFENSGLLDTTKWIMLEQCDSGGISLFSKTGDYSFLISDHTGQDGTNIQTKTGLFSASNVEVEFDIYIAQLQSSGSCNFGIIDSTQNKGYGINSCNFYLRIESDTLCYYQNRTVTSWTGPSSSKVPVKSWFKMKIKVENDLTARVYINDTEVLTGQSSPFSSLNLFQITSASNWENGEDYYIDNVKITEY